YLRISAGQAAPRNSAGCKELGVLQSDISWRSTYKIVDPDTFIGGTLCNAEALGCEAFTSKSGTYVFRDPGEDVCSWNPDIGNGGGFVDKHGNNCPQNPPMAKQCAPEQSSCTAYLPTDPKLSEGANTAKFMLADSVNKGDCSSVNNDIGCVNFKVNYSTTGEGTSIPPSKIGPDERDTVIEVDQARQCAEWFAPTTTSLVDDPQSRSKREVVYDFGRCQKLGDNGACVKWVDTTDDGYPEAYLDASGNPDVFEIADYKLRYTVNNKPATLFSGAWDYSGYSIPGIKPIERLLPDDLNALNNGSAQCRSYPEEDSPFSSEKGVRYTPDGPDILDKNLENLNLCERDNPDDIIGTDSCLCSYKKVSTATDVLY
ncbi:MAG: hypothetical protein COV79_02335, partial [Parcubacteria group bacterium CG11_big_fil_rev_8_21_14_0_20_41_14]